MQNFLIMMTWIFYDAFIFLIMIEKVRYSVCSTNRLVRYVWQGKLPLLSSHMYIIMLSPFLLGIYSRWRCLCLTLLIYIFSIDVFVLEQLHLLCCEDCWWVVWLLKRFVDVTTCVLLKCTFWFPCCKACLHNKFSSSWFLFSDWSVVCWIFFFFFMADHTKPSPPTSTPFGAGGGGAQTIWRCPAEGWNGCPREKWRKAGWRWLGGGQW